MVLLQDFHVAGNISSLWILHPWMKFLWRFIHDQWRLEEIYSMPLYLRKKSSVSVSRPPPPHPTRPPTLSAEGHFVETRSAAVACDLCSAGTYSKEIQDDGLGKPFRCSLCPPGYSHLSLSRWMGGDHKTWRLVFWCRCRSHHSQFLLCRERDTFIYFFLAINGDGMCQHAHQLISFAMSTHWPLVISHGWLENHPEFRFVKI